MANENDMKTLDAAGPNGTESPVGTPVSVPALSWVYVMSCQGRTKIGLADDVARRRGSIEMAIGMAVDIEGSRPFASRSIARQMEMEMHRQFAESRRQYLRKPNEKLMRK